MALKTDWQNKIVLIENIFIQTGTKLNARDILLF